MTIDKETQDYIRDNIQERLDEMFYFADLPYYIDACCGDNEEETEWAEEHIGVRIVVEAL